MGEELETDSAPRKYVKAGEEQTMRQKIMKMTDQNVTTTTTLQSKIDRKLKSVKRNLKKYAQEEPEPEQRDIVDDDLAYENVKNDTVFALDTEF